MNGSVTLEFPAKTISVLVLKGNSVGIQKGTNKKWHRCNKVWETKEGMNQQQETAS